MRYKSENVEDITIFNYPHLCDTEAYGSEAVKQCDGDDLKGLTKSEAQKNCNAMGGSCGGIILKKGGDENAPNWFLRDTITRTNVSTSYCPGERDPDDSCIGKCTSSNSQVLTKLPLTTSTSYKSEKVEDITIFNYPYQCDAQYGSEAVKLCDGDDRKGLMKSVALKNCDDMGGSCGGIILKKDGVENAANWFLRDTITLTNKSTSYCPGDQDPPDSCNRKCTSNNSQVLTKPSTTIFCQENCSTGKICVGIIDDNWVVCREHTEVVGPGSLPPVTIPVAGKSYMYDSTADTGPEETTGFQVIGINEVNISFNGEDGNSSSTVLNEKPFTVAHSNNNSTLTLDNAWCLASNTKIPKVVNGNVQHVEVKDLNDGDMVRTTRGDFPLSHIMKTHTIGPHTYVKVEQGALGENLPSQDLYITHEHSFSLGYYKNSVLNRNIHDTNQDDMVYLHVTADQLADKLPGITRVQKEFDSMFNLVFDEHVSLDIYGLEVMMHHPKGNPYTLPEEKYQDKSKINNKVQKPLFANYGMLENVKPVHMEMKDFLRNCITANLDNKFRLEDINHPSFAPQKTMLSEDMREKLRVN
jgi:hypothetical protein